jgi:hypothetical protein
MLILRGFNPAWFLSRVVLHSKDHRVRLRAVACIIAAFFSARWTVQYNRAQYSTVRAAVTQRSDAKSVVL